MKLPDELSARFATNQRAAELFDKLAASHQQQYVQWIEEGQKEETREKRAAKTIEMLEAAVTPFD